MQPLIQTGAVYYWLVGLGLLALAFLSRRGWLKLFGPVLFYDLVRTARRSRFVLLRVIYAVVLLLLLWVVHLQYADYISGIDLNFQRYRGGPGPSPAEIMSSRAKELAKFAEAFFFTLIGVQFAATLLLTPAYTAGAIADEKDRKTLEFLLATDLVNREIVLSKLFVRVANLALLILTGLPILSLTQLWGGVDPELVVAGFAVTGLTMASLASLSILLSVYAKKPRDAIVLAYLVTAAYLGTASTGLILLKTPPPMPGTVWRGPLGARRPAPFSPPPSPTMTDSLIDGVNTGNPLAIVRELQETLKANKPLSSVIPGLLRGYAIFHGLVTVFCASLAVVRLRRVALSQTHVKARTKKRRWRWRARPRVGSAPMIWKEVFAEPGFSFNWFGKIILGIIILVSFVPALWMATQYVLEMGPWSRSTIWGRPNFRDDINNWVRIVGTLVACLTLLGVALRAASSVSGERDRQTFDNLLTTPLDSNSILFAKWLGSVLGVRWAWLWLCLIWILGLATGGLSVVTVPWLALSWVVYAAFLATLGLWYSVVSRNTLRATLGTLAATVGLGAGHWLLWLVCCVPQTGFGPGIRDFELYGLTPPAAIAWLSYHSDNIEFQLPFFRGSDPMTNLMSVLVGLILWAGGAGFLWFRTVDRFRTLTRRRPFPRPPTPRRQRETGE